MWISALVKREINSDLPSTKPAKWMAINSGLLNPKKLFCNFWELTWNFLYKSERKANEELPRIFVAFFFRGMEGSGEREYYNILSSGSFLASSVFWRKELPPSPGPRQPLVLLALFGSPTTVGFSSSPWRQRLDKLIGCWLCTPLPTD